MPKPILLNAFEMLVPVHQSPGLWRHPADQSRRYNDLSYWVGLAQSLERGGFHGIFFADILGQYDVYAGSADEAVRGGVQYPMLDPMLIVSALAGATQRLGFGVTASVTYEQPYLLARKFSTLDHLTQGRVAWNIVTSYQDSAARNLGLGEQIPHDERYDRYDRAEEYMDVVYKLWEGSVEDDAVIADPAANVFVDPSKVHDIDHEGRYFSVPGPALAAPSPQRTPLLFQAGASPPRPGIRGQPRRGDLLQRLLARAHARLGGFRARWSPRQRPVEGRGEDLQHGDRDRRGDG